MTVRCQPDDIVPSSQQEPRHYVIVINAASGSNDCAQVRQRIVERLGAAGCAHEFVPIDDTALISEIATDAASLARSTGALLVAVGGDGTINAVVTAALEHEIPMAVLPQGTFNFFGRTHGIPETTDAAIDVLLHGRLVPVQVARVNERTFIVNASVGLYPQVLEDREAWKQRFGRGRLIAFFSGLATLLRGYHSLRMQISEMDGKARELRTPTLVVANNALQLKLIGIADAPSLERGRLVAITLKHVDKLQMIGLMLRGALGKLGDSERVETFGFQRMTVVTRSRKRRIKVALDGEIFRMAMPLTFEALPNVLQLLVPQAGDEEARQ